MPRIIVKTQVVGNQVAVDIDGQGFKQKECDVLDQYVKAAGGDPAAARVDYKPEYAMESTQQAEGLG